MKKTLTIFIFTFGCSVCEASADTIEFHCPDKLSVNQKAILTTEKSNWIANNTEYSLNYSRTTLNTNPKEEGNSLRPDEEKETATSATEKYDLAFYHQNGEGVHVACVYFDTTVTISQLIPNEFNRCEILYQKQQGRNKERGVYCSK